MNAVFLPVVLVPAAILAVFAAASQDACRARIMGIKDEIKAAALNREAIFAGPGAKKDTGFKLFKLGFNMGYRCFIFANCLIGVFFAATSISFLNNVKLAALSMVIWIVFIHQLVDISYRERIRGKLAGEAELALQLLAEAYKLSDSLLDALIQVAPSVKPPLKDDFDILIKDYRLNKDLNTCLREFAERTDNKDIEMFVQGLILSMHYGTDTHLVLAQTAEIIRDRRMLREELRNETAGKSFTVKLFLIVLPLLLAVMFIKSAEARNTFLHTARGQNLVCLTLVIGYASWYFTRFKGAIEQL